LKVVSILAPQNNEIANLVLKQLSAQITDGILSWTNPSKIDNKQAIRWATFWINCVSDEKVKARLQHDQLPLKLYNLLKETDSEASKVKILKDFDEVYISLVVELIVRIAMGSKDNEDQLTNMLIEDLNLSQNK
jgi:hypothetical protein